MRKITLILVFVLCFIASSTSAFASNVSTMINVRDVVPSEYFEKYKGVFKTPEEVYAAFNQENRPISPSTQSNTNGGIKVNSVDELAALIAFLKDSTSTKQEPTVLEDSNSNITEFTTTANENVTRTNEVTIYDNYIYWIKGYVTIDYVKSTGKITKTTARSALLGVTFGHTWKPDSPRITVISDIKRQVIFSGVLETNVWFDGVGTIISENVNYTYGVTSISTIE